jgi:8-oxo-dGTP pyrophosphatase MutT (NUDIX family)
MAKYFVINTEAAIFRNGKWLVGVRSKKESEAPGLLSFVGGTVDDSDTANMDTLEHTLVREVYEEVRIKVKVLDFVNNTSFVSKKGNNVLNVVFLCSIDSGEPTISDTEEFEELLWLTKEEILGYTNVPQWLCKSLNMADLLVNKPSKSE